MKSDQLKKAGKTRSLPKLKELLQIGMEDAAVWMLDIKTLRHVGDSSAHWRYLTAIPNYLCAFAWKGEVLYIGKTTKTLSKRFSGYCEPISGSSADKRLQQAIMKLMRQRKEVRILVLPPAVPLKWEDYPINLAAGLEDALVEAFKPQWNGKNKKIMTESQQIEETEK